MSESSKAAIGAILLALVVLYEKVIVQQIQQLHQIAAAPEAAHLPGHVPAQVAVVQAFDHGWRQ